MHWDKVANNTRNYGSGNYYHSRLAQIAQFLVSPGLSVLEIGCGTGDLLAAVKPKLGVGVDFSHKMAAQAAQKYPHLRFVQADAHALGLKQTFDVVILSDLLNDVWDAQSILAEVSKVCTPRTRIIINFYSHLWEIPLSATQRLGLSRPLMLQNWLTEPDLKNLLYLANFEVIKHWTEIIFPLPIPLVSHFFNQFLARIPPFKHLALTNFIVARPIPANGSKSKPKVSVIVPARNEEGNIPQIFERIPEMGGGTEIIFVEGHSRDRTYEAIEQGIAKHPERESKLFKQTDIGKGGAVRQGFTEASGDILMILDSDLTVPPEDLPLFYEALVNNKGEFINGVRLIYPLEDQAMRFFNLIGNKFFSLAFSWLLGQPLKDTLCGTKVLWKTDYDLIAANRAYFGDFDPFGDFDLLFGAAKQNLKIVDLPVRYRSRTYGTTNIQRWKHGWLLLQMVLFAARRIKFI